MYIQLYQGIPARELVIASVDRPMIYLALLHAYTPSICGDHDISEEVRTLRYLKWVYNYTSSSMNPFNIRREAARLGGSFS